MGSDDIFERRKAKTLLRKKHSKSLGRKFLIICEGSKTEVNYFEDLRDALNLSQETVQIKYVGSDPVTIVKKAVQLFDAEKKKEGAFNQVYCVFDGEHESSVHAVSQVNDHCEAGKPFHAITSTPCFEFWLLLHFSYTDKPFHCVGKKSICDQVVAELRLQQDFKNYEKKTRVYSLLAQLTDQAIKNAQKLEKCSQSQNPSTHVHHLVLVLRELAKTNV
jgi:RloB-like protein